MWNKMSEPWKVCFEEAWEAYCSGSIPIGAVIVSKNGEIISKGRNMIYEDIKEPRRLSKSRLAHAEMNAIYNCEEEVKNTIIYSTMEPCVMCFGAIVMNSIKEVNYAARDGVAGGVNLKNSFIEKRGIKINKHNPQLEIVQLVIKTDYIYRNRGDRAEELLSVWEKTCPVGIQIGRQWYKENRLLKFKEDKYSIEQIIEEISKNI
ncbi:nucleoside deaminase [Dethiothermospora halolimnae]|uniref:nucleoside deaminase n=1 Tax=Dethiothermospora halolimnae TaxID=3114390 RepID=UPI003CCBCB74